jgi:NAD(P)-dependent dehydrogenase (short-subunit alcohol dehydrogenase family)
MAMAHTLIVGGTRGLGRALAHSLAARGQQVSVIGRRKPADTDTGLPQVKHWIADLLEADAGTGVAQAIVGERGPLNYLVFAQRYRGKDDDWAGEIQVSLTATRRIIEALVPSFAPEGDKAIAIVSSVFGDFVGEGQPAGYHLGKAGINSLARYYAVNLGRKGIRVNAVTPFTFLKDESREFYTGNKELSALYREIVPLGRMGTAEDSVNAIAFLCSPAASFINGQNLYVDGGLSLVWPEALARKLKNL